METIKKSINASKGMKSVFLGEELREGQEIDLLYNIVVFW